VANRQHEEWQFRIMRGIASHEVEAGYCKWAIFPFLILFRKTATYSPLNGLF
jgi:hypothetical protein